MEEKNGKLKMNSLSEISGGVNKIVQFRAVTKDQAKDYQNHGSTVVNITRPGIYRMDNGQQLDFRQDGLYLLY